MNRRELLVSGAATISLLSPQRAAGQGGPDLPAAWRGGPVSFRRRSVETPRHRSAYVEAGPPSGPLMVFLHGYPELSIVWREQMEHFAAIGWRCVAPDMRGYGGSSIPVTASAYTVREISTDMAELHDALGGEPAVWIGHDWGAPIAWAMASNHSARCRGVGALSVPYFARGFALPHLVALVDRRLYPVDRYPVGQWDYWLYYRENFARSYGELSADVPNTIANLFVAFPPGAEAVVSGNATLRAKGGRFAPSYTAPPARRDPKVLSQAAFDLHVETFGRTGYAGPNAYYLNDPDNIAFAGEARNFGRIDQPALFIHGEYDQVCETLYSRLADPMRADCSNLTEGKVASGHFPMLEQGAAVNRLIEQWVRTRIDPR